MVAAKRWPSESIPSATTAPPVVRVCQECRRKDSAGHKMSCTVLRYGAKVVWVDRFTNKIIKDIGEI